MVGPAVILDAGPLGLLANPQLTRATAAGLQWLGQLLAAGRRVVVPAVADYEVRRELLRLRAVQSVASLDALAQRLEYLPVSYDAFRLAAEFWAQARQGGYPTAPDPALDSDVILAAQAATLGAPAVVATANLRHLSRFVPADLWQNIVP
ncbi:MAG: nucleic acid-binding protein [Gemmataceae bacterium]